MDRVGQHYIAHEGRADEEQDRRREDERKEGAPLMAVEARGNEHPDLGGDDGKREANSGKHPNLHIGEERLVERCVDEMGIGLALQRLRQGLGQERIDVFGERKADDEAHRKRNHRPNQPLAQLDQMIHQRRFGRFKGGFVVGGGRDHGACASRAKLLHAAQAARIALRLSVSLAPDQIFVELLIGGQDHVLRYAAGALFGQWALVA